MSAILGSICILSDTVLATAAIKERQLIGFDGAPAGSGDPVLGASRTDAASGVHFTADIIGVFDFIAGAPIPKGSEVQSDANGAPIVKAAGSKCGTAMTEAANIGDVVKILFK